VGDYGNASIFVRNTSSGIITGVMDKFGTYVSDEEIPLLNATDGIAIRLVLAWSTRMILIEVVPWEGDVLVGYNVR
jgi:hypothetical protein